MKRWIRNASLLTILISQASMAQDAWMVLHCQGTRQNILFQVSVESRDDGHWAAVSTLTSWRRSPAQDWVRVKRRDTTLANFETGLELTLSTAPSLTITGVFRDPDGHAHAIPAIDCKVIE